MTKAYKRVIVFFMRFFTYLLLVVVNFSFVAVIQQALAGNKPDFPDTELKQIIMRGAYYPADPKGVKEMEKEYLEKGILKAGETLQEEHPREFKRMTGRYDVTIIKYCYTEVKIKNREPCYKDNLRMRLYDNKGHIIAEDCLRLDEDLNKYDEHGRYTEDYIKQYYDNSGPLKGPKESRMKPEDGIFEGRSIVIYLPYDKNVYERRIVRLEGKKEIVIESYSDGPPVEKSTLIRLYDDSKYFNHGFAYNEESQCHISPGPM